MGTKHVNVKLTELEARMVISALRMWSVTLEDDLTSGSGGCYSGHEYQAMQRADKKVAQALRELWAATGA